MSGARRALARLADATVALSFGAPGYRLRAPDFDARDTDVDLSGQVALITGATSGLGQSLAGALVARGARVFVVGRDPSRTRAVCDALGARAEPLLADLAELAQVRALCAELRARTTRLDRLVLNAGVLLDEREVTSEGIEKTFATNVLSGFLMARTLEPLLEASAPSRVIHVTSGGMYTQRIDLARVLGPDVGYDGVVAYAQTKRAQVILNELWAERWRGRGISSSAMHPGWADTPGVERSLPRFRRLLRPLLRDAAQGADTALWLCTAPNVDDDSGRLWFDRAPRRTHVLPRTRETAADRAALWALCERLTDGPA